MRTVDCYDFYLWSIGELHLPPKVVRELLNDLQERDKA
jgi:hypothetical protein